MRYIVDCGMGQSPSLVYPPTPIAPVSEDLRRFIQMLVILASGSDVGGSNARAIEQYGRQVILNTQTRFRNRQFPAVTLSEITTLFNMAVAGRGPNISSSAFNTARIPNNSPTYYTTSVR